MRGSLREGLQNPEAGAGRVLGHWPPTAGGEINVQIGTYVCIASAALARFQLPMYCLDRTILFGGNCEGFNK